MKNRRRYLIEIVLYVVGCLVFSHAGGKEIEWGQEGSYLPSDADVPDWAIWGERSFSLEETISILLKNGYCELSVDGAVLLNLEEGVFVRSLSSDPLLGVAVALVDRHEKGMGVYYDRLLVVRDRIDSTESYFVLETMERGELKKGDGRRRFITMIGSIEKYPVIDLFMGCAEFPEPPTMILYDWYQWDVENAEEIGPIDSALAEGRLKTWKKETQEIFDNVTRQKSNE
tara:strand:+ start:315 stop:1001 length:687 start_codon:yes stop_codon:yes gene_type:complete